MRVNLALCDRQRSATCGVIVFTPSILGSISRQYWLSVSKHGSAKLVYLLRVVVLMPMDYIAVVVLAVFERQAADIVLITDSADVQVDVRCSSIIRSSENISHQCGFVSIFCRYVILYTALRQAVIKGVCVA